MVRLKQRWNESLLFRRVVVASVFILLSVGAYVCSLLPRAVSLPSDDLRAKSVANLGEQAIILEGLNLGENDLVLSYEGSRNEVADLRLENASLDGRLQHLLFPGIPPAAGKISYVTADSGLQTSGATPRSTDTCRTTIKVHASPGSAAITSLKILQSDRTAGAQRFRQAVIDAGQATLQLQVSTDSPADSSEQAARPSQVAACHKLLTLAGRPPVDLPEIPVTMTVTNGTMDFHFNPMDPSLSIWTGEGETFEGLSLGGDGLHAKSLRVERLGGPQSSKADFDVRATAPAALLTISGLKIGSDSLRVTVGREGEEAVARAGGTPLNTYNLSETVPRIPGVRNNPVISFGLGVLILTPLGAWVKKVCFPGS